MKKQLYRNVERLKKHYEAFEALTEQVMTNHQLFPDQFAETMVVGLVEYASILKDFESLTPTRKG